MNALATGALIDAVRARTSRERAKTDVARWPTLNATTERGLPPLPPDDNDPNLGMLYALALGENAGGQGSGGGGGTTDTNASQSGVTNAAKNQGTGQATTGHSAAAAGSGSDGQTSGGGTRTDAGASNGTAAATSGGSAGSAGSQGFVIPWKTLLGGAALVLSGGGAAAIPSIISWATSDRTESVAPAEPSSAEYPLLDWLREHSHHLPPEGAE